MTILHPHEQFDKLGTVGRKVVGSRPIRLLDDYREEVAGGLRDELYSCSPYCFSGYWQQSQATLDAFRGEYLSVGDIALRDADGFIRPINRRTNIIILDGENLYPSEVEAVLCSHPQVSEIMLTVSRRLDFQLAYGSPSVFGEARFIRIADTPGELRDNRRGEVEVYAKQSVALAAIVKIAGNRAAVLMSNGLKNCVTNTSSEQTNSSLSWQIRKVMKKGIALNSCAIQQFDIALRN